MINFVQQNAGIKEEIIAVKGTLLHPPFSLQFRGWN
jgi:hypothetical protein